MAFAASSSSSHAPTAQFSWGDYSNLDPNTLPPYSIEPSRLILVSNDTSDFAPLPITRKVISNNNGDCTLQNHLNNLKATNSESDPWVSISNEQNSRFDLPVLIGLEPGKRSIGYIRASILQHHTFVRFPLSKKASDGSTVMKVKEISMMEFGPSYHLKDPKNLNSAFRLPDAESRTLLMNISSGRASLKAYGIIWGRVGADLSTPLIPGDATDGGHLVEFRFFTKRTSKSTQEDISDLNIVGVEDLD